MFEEGIYRFNVQHNGEGFKILRPVPTETSWGILECLRGTEIGDMLPVVSGEDMSQALHGRARPLVNSMGRSPQANLRKLPSDMICTLIDSCILADRAVCFPCKKLPHCYDPPGYSGVASMAAAAVVRAWIDDRYVIIVEGPEFSL